jgi:hypothetical protein
MPLLVRVVEGNRKLYIIEVLLPQKAEFVFDSRIHALVLLSVSINPSATHNSIHFRMVVLAAEASNVIDLRKWEPPSARERPPEIHSDSNVEKGVWQEAAETEDRVVALIGNGSQPAVFRRLRRCRRRLL